MYQYKSVVVGAIRNRKRLSIIKERSCDFQYIQAFLDFGGRAILLSTIGTFWMKEVLRNPGDDSDLEVI